MCSTVQSHGHRIACLHKDRARTCELAHEAFTSSQVADNPARRNTLERVFAIPRDEVPVVDDVLFAFAELEIDARISHTHGYNVQVV